MTRRISAFVLGLVVVLAIPIGRPAAAGGASITALGWWTQRPGASEQPSGSFEIALSPTGPVSEAALRIRVDAVQLTSALLQLTESSAAGAEVAGILACPTTAQWTPANPGPWNEAPTPNCNRNVPLSRSLSGEWSGDIEALLSLGTVSIVLVPSSHADTQGAPIPYQLEFSKATLIATAPEVPTPTPTSAPATEPPAAPPDAPVGTSVPADDAPATAEPSPGVVEPSPEPVSTAEPEEAVDVGGDGLDRPWWRVAILIPIAAIVGGCAVYARRLARRKYDIAG